MDRLLIAVSLGIASGALLVAAQRFARLAFVGLVPLGLACVWYGPLEAAASGAFVGALGSAPSVRWPEFRRLVPITIVPSGVAWASASALVAWVVDLVGVAALAVAFPAAAVLALLPLRWAGAPRWVSNPLACTQQRSLVLVHTARLFGDLATSALLASSNAAIVLLIEDAVVASTCSFTLLGFGLAFGRRSVRAAELRSARAARIRVAAVVVDGPPPSQGPLTGLWPMESSDYRNVDRTIDRYEPHVRRAAELGAVLIALPEVSVCVDARTRSRWIEAVTAWARSTEATIVAPFVDTSVPVNTLVVVDANGVVATYDKQHPARGLEPPPRTRTPPGLASLRDSNHVEVSISSVLCVDLDYGDLIRPVRREGGLLVCPSNDWFRGFDEWHHRSAVWSAAITGVPVLRATGHGISSAIDGAGRVLDRQSSETGPVVLVVDLPVAVPESLPAIVRCSRIGEA